MEKKIIGRCPLCGGNVVKTCKGYRCENNIAEQPTCVLNINGIIGNRKMSDEEITELLEHRFILLDGFASKEGKAFPSVLELADNGAINMQSVIGKCPHCGGDIRVGTRAFNCSNYSNQQAPCNFAIWRNIGGHQVCLTDAKYICENEITSNELEMYRVGTRAFNCSNYSNQQAPCNFAIWRNIGGHQLSLTEAREICEKEITSNELEMYRDDGTIYRKRLGLSPDKLQIVKI